MGTDHTAEIKPELEAAVALSDRLLHPLSLLFAQGIMCNTLYLTHDLDACRASATKCCASRPNMICRSTGQLDLSGWVQHRRYRTT
jgi:hypothetical protein